MNYIILKSQATCWSTAFTSINCVYSISAVCDFTILHCVIVPIVIHAYDSGTIGAVEQLAIIPSNMVIGVRSKRTGVSVVLINA